MLKVSIRPDSELNDAHSIYDSAYCFYYVMNDTHFYSSETDRQFNITVPGHQIIFDAGSNGAFDLTINTDGTVLDASFRQKLETLDADVDAVYCDEGAAIVFEPSDHIISSDVSFARPAGSSPTLFVFLHPVDKIRKFYRISSSAWVGVNEMLNIVAFRFDGVAFDE